MNNNHLIEENATVARELTDAEMIALETAWINDALGGAE